MSTRSFANTLGKAQKSEAKMSLKIRQALEEGKTKRVRSLMGCYLNSFQAKLCAVHEANKDLPVKLRLRAGEKMDLAGKLDPYKPCGERARVSLVKKEDKDDELRPIMKFSIERMALHRLTAGALAPLSDKAIQPNQYAVKGGRDKAMEAVLHHAYEGFEAMVQIDIKNCYPSFNGEVLPDLLLLGDEVVRNVILAEHVPYDIHYNGNTMDKGSGELEHYVSESDLTLLQQGIPQGSCISPLICEIALSQLDFDLGDDARVVIYADNFLVLAKDEEAAIQAADKLMVAIASNPAGGFCPVVTDANFGELSDEANFKGFNKYGAIDFLGYEIKKLGNQFILSPSEKNMDKFQYQLGKDLAHVWMPPNSTQKSLDRLDRIEKSIKGWAASFKMWGQVGLHHQQALMGLEGRRKEITHFLKKQKKFTGKTNKKAA